MQRIFVGDVQGCADELSEVVARARADFGRGFELWVVGDLVNRGPHSLRALRTVRELHEAGRARLVLGNHEISLLETALGTRPLAETDTFADVLDARDADDWVDWLLARPLIEVSRLGEQPFAMVHAAVHPDWSLADAAAHAERAAAGLRSGRAAARRLLAAGATDAERDDLERLTSCRSVAGSAWSDLVPLEAPGSLAWHAAWSRRRHDYGVVYGHWSLQGLHVAPGLRGLDTGCVHNGRDGPRALTAWLPDPRSPTPFGVPDERFWQIPAKRVYRKPPGAVG
jgi:bis(5'-nucleosyl)-tetraphosphatase (symmetrical)